MTHTISIFIGSIRPQRQGKTVAEWIAASLRKAGHTINMVDPAEHIELQTLEVPYRYNQNPSADLKALHEKLVASDAIILITPEYNHSYSGTLKNAIDQFFHDEFGNKPFGIVSYSVGPFGGVRAAEHLQPVITELGGIALPKSLPITNVGSAFRDGKLADEAYTARLDAFKTQLEWYADALKAQRMKK